MPARRPATGWDGRYQRHYCPPLRAFPRIQQALSVKALRRRFPVASQGRRLSKGRAHKSCKQGVRPVGAALELGMELHADEEALAGDFHGLHQPPVGGEAGEGEAGGLQRVAVGVVELIAVAVALADLQRIVAMGDGRAPFQPAGITAQPQRAALVDLVVLIGHEMNDLMRAVLVELVGICLGEARDVARVLDHRDLHAQADAEVGHMVFAGILCRQDHALDAAVAEAAGDDHAVYRPAGSRLRARFA